MLVDAMQVLRLSSIVHLLGFCSLATGDANDPCRDNIEDSIVYESVTGVAALQNTSPVA